MHSNFGNIAQLTVAMLKQSKLFMKFCLNLISFVKEAAHATKIYLNKSYHKNKK